MQVSSEVLPGKWWNSVVTDLVSFEHSYANKMCKKRITMLNS